MAEATEVRKAPRRRRIIYALHWVWAHLWYIGRRIRVRLSPRLRKWDMPESDRCHREMLKLRSIVSNWRPNA